jgi:predicted  nucleic acid-binding Zn-ribbon protein
MIGMSFLMAVLVAGLVVAGWFIANQHQLLAAEQQALDDAEKRIVVLEDRLRVTDEAMTETGQNTKEQIGFWESEIRKLWAVSNERNRKWIKDNQAALERLQKTLDELKGSNAALAGAVGRHESAFSQQQAIIDQLAGIDLQIQRMVAGQRDLTDKINVAQQTVAGLQSGLAGRVSENEQAVAAIDAYRLQLNSRLADIERQLNQLMSSANL